MLADKLLVNIFLVFVPLLVYSALSDYRHMKQTPLLMGGCWVSLLCFVLFSRIAGTASFGISDMFR